MRYKLLGQSGLRVSELCLGTMTFGEDWGWGASGDESRKIFDRYLEAGGNVIDTAVNYTNGTSEQLVGSFIAAERPHLIVSTKYTLSTRNGDPNASGNHRKNLVQSLDTSLKRLKTDYLDLFWLHAWDYMTPVEEVMRALDDVVRAGKVLYVGISDTPAWVISRANMLAELRGWTAFVGVQLEYNLLLRDGERDLLPMARTLGLAALAWSPLARGILTGKYQGGNVTGTRISQNDAQLGGRNEPIINAVVDIAKEIGCSPSQVALNWVRQQEGLMLPILGCRKLTQLEDNLGCLNFALTDQQRDRLNTVSQIDLGFPHSFLAGDGARQLVYGGTYDKIDARQGRIQAR